jgi:HD-GYP domain-containing protein (c-di-GMP phosphodiesterase class II)
VALVSRALKVLRRAFDDARLGRAVRMAEVTTVVDEVVESVERGPRTLLEVLRTKTRDEYTYLHSVAVCTLMVNVARQLGKGDGETRDYGLAGLLHDLGKMGISELILNKAGALTEAEFAAVRTHPEHGYQLLCETPDIPEMALDVCRHHHEKMDGTGYPFGLPAEAISLVARVGAVCDVYDALTSDRVYKEAWSPGEAIAAMWSWEGHFDRQLLFTFMQSVGIFPTGMLVQLRSNRLAIVLDPKRRNSGPRVLAFYATRDRAFIEAEEIVIKDNLANDSIVAPAEPEDWGLENWDRVAERLLSGDHRLLAA